YRGRLIRFKVDLSQFIDIGQVDLGQERWARFDLQPSIPHADISDLDVIGREPLPSIDLNDGIIAVDTRAAARAAGLNADRAAAHSGTNAQTSVVLRNPIANLGPIHQDVVRAF